MRCRNRQSSRGLSLGLCLVLICLLSACSKAKTPAQASADKEAGAVTSKAPPIESPNLALHLNVGDKFPLQKTVTTTLVQPGASAIERSTAQKEFLLTITVEAMPQKGPRAGQKQMGVKFHAVRFTRELNGKKLEYDSRKATETIPLVAQPYHGLIGNSFSFWLGQDNQIEGIVDFDKFVERCLKHVPKERFEEVWNNLATQTGADGIANFVDDSIGLLPKAKVTVGESWAVTRRTQQPIPMVCKTRYTLQQMDGQQAEVSILGEILPGAILPNAVPGASAKNLNMSIQGGKATGSCTIDLRTGLPIHSQVEQYVDMHVKLTSGEEFVQHKHTITTIRAFPAMEPPTDRDAPIAGRTDGSQTPSIEAEFDAPPTRIAQPAGKLPRR
jgi:hypothetical protein